MYRKVHNTMLAFSATGVLLLVSLMAGEPATQAPQSAPLVRMVNVGPLVLRLQAPASRSAEAQAASIEARAKALEAKIEASASAADSLTHVASFATEVATEAAFLAAFASETSAAASVEQARTDQNRTTPADDGQTQRRHVRRARAALALPYFSFAQGLRRNRS